MKNPENVSTHGGSSPKIPEELFPKKSKRTNGWILFRSHLKKTWNELKMGRKYEKADASEHWGMLSEEDQNRWKAKAAEKNAQYAKSQVSSQTKPTTDRKRRAKSEPKEPLAKRRKSNPRRASAGRVEGTIARPATLASSSSRPDTGYGGAHDGSKLLGHALNAVILMSDGRNFKDLGLTRDEVKDQNSLRTALKKKGATIEKIMTDAKSDPIEKELAKFVGLNGVKNQVRGLRVAHDQFGIAFSSNFVFKGNPGCGKTEFGKILGKILYMTQTVRENKFVFKKAGGMVGNHVGETKTNVENAINEARGGVIMIDETYQFSQGGSENVYGTEAINVILNEMKASQPDPVFIFAGYPAEMEEYLNQNDGLRRRIGIEFNFPDYTPEELAEIFFMKFEEMKKRVTKRKKTIMLEEEVNQSSVTDLMRNISDRVRAKENGSIADKIIKKAMQNAARRGRSTLSLRDLDKAIRDIQ